MKLFKVLNKKRPLVVGTRTFFSKKSSFRPRGQIIIGNDCFISDFCTFDAEGKSIKIGNNVSINAGTAIYGEVTVGNYVRIAAHVVIVASDHIYNRTDIPIALQGTNRKGVMIGDDVWIGAGAKILDGTKIGNGCIVGAGSVVKGELEPYGIYAGAIAKKIKSRHG